MAAKISGAASASRTNRYSFGRYACGAAALLAALAAWLTPLAIARADDASLEYKVKATYLYKFGAFVDWPSSAFGSPASPLTVCVAGKDPFGGILDKATEGQTVADRPVVVRRLDLVAHNSGCQILYIGASDRQSVGQALDAVRGTGVLTVTDEESGDTAGIIHFVIQDNHVRFDIDDQAAAENGLTVSSKLLGLALSVRPRK